MPTTYEGQPTPQGRYAIVVSRYNRNVTASLLEAAVATLRAAGVADERIDVAWVPGAFEIPQLAGRLAQAGKYDAILCLGAVIRGETTHDQHINRAVSLGIMEVARSAGCPVLFGVLTCDTLEQALNRAGGNLGNKGQECAQAALEMVSLWRKLP